jgi:UPF0755 protein
VSDIGLINGPGDGRDPDDEQDRHEERLHDDDGAGYYERFSTGGGRRRGGSRKRRSWIPALVLLVIAAVVFAGGTYGYGKLKDRFASAPDYPGPGSGTVLFQVHKGDSVAAMGRGLEKQGVVRSVDAFVGAARKDPKSSTIQVGYYRLKRQMRSADAVAVLVNPKNQIQSVVAVPEGSRVRDIVDAIVKHTDLRRSAVTAALRQPGRLGLPAAAAGNPEGYLFPATYTVVPGESARELLRQMVAKTVQVEQQLDLAGQAKAKGLSPEQVLTVASILEYEANRSVDYPKVARVIYNRLNIDMALQLDSTVSYVSKREGDVWTTAADRASDSLYNTYKHTGLPPGPIGSPGQETIEAALNPAKGNWLYFVPDFANGTTLFTNSYAEHQRNAEKAKEYCRTHSSC